ncbi:MAG: 50S ribosomal protein P1 [Euryarchaeota archaeon]|nr:MAG: 50S ribosomal protein L12 [ANME-2 cluster archaeon]MEA1864376.1 50S ribosomal protein P1 [Euryarchaeota archaeon]
MEYIYAAMMLHSAGKEITEDGIVSMLGAAGIDVDDARVKALVAALDGVDIESAIAQAAVAPVAASAAAPAPAASAEAPAAEAAPAAEEATEEEKKEEEETGMAGLGALFG